MTTHRTLAPSPRRLLAVPLALLAVGVAHAAPCRVTIGADGFERGCLPALAKDGAWLALPLVASDGGRGNPNLAVQIAPVEHGRGQYFPVLTPDEFERFSSEATPFASAGLRKLVGPRLEALDAVLAAGDYAPLRKLDVPSPEGPGATQKLTVEDGDLQVAVRGPKVEVKRGGKVVATATLANAATGPCRGANAPFVAELWVPAGARSVVAVLVGYRGNDSCMEPGPAWQVMPLAGGAPSASGTEVDPNAATTANDRGMLRYREKDWKGAADLFRAAILADPSHVKAHYNLACVAALDGDRATAIAQLRWLAQSDDPEARAKLAKASRDPDLASVAKDPAVRKLLDGARAR